MGGGGGLGGGNRGSGGDEGGGVNGGGGDGDLLATHRIETDEELLGAVSSVLKYTFVSLCAVLLLQPTGGPF